MDFFSTFDNDWHETMQKSVNAAVKNALKSVKLPSKEVIC